MKVGRHPYTKASGEVLIEAVGEGDDAAVILQVDAIAAPQLRGEGASLHIDAAIGSFSVSGTVQVSASVALTPKQVRKLIGELEQAIA